MSNDNSIKPRLNFVKNIDSDKIKKMNIKDKIRHSNFYLTINSNKPIDMNDENDKLIVDRFENSLVEIFNKPENFIKIVSEGNYTMDYFRKLDVQIATELGPNTRLLHTHIIILITHGTKVRLDYEKIRNLVCGLNDLDNIYMNNIIIRGNNIDRLEDYLHKNQHLLKN